MYVVSHQQYLTDFHTMTAFTSTFELIFKQTLTLAYTRRILELD